MDEVLIYHNIEYEDFESLSDRQKEILIIEYCNSKYPITWT